MMPADHVPPIRHANRRIRLAYLVSHPIQYQAPLLRRIAQEPDIDLTVLFGSDFSVRGYTDAGFGVGVKWDIPLLDGYKYELLPCLRDTGNASFASPINRGIVSRLRGGPFDALWVHGYASVNAMHGILAAHALGIPVLLRAESWLGDRTAQPRQARPQARPLATAQAPDRSRAPHRHPQRPVLAPLLRRRRTAVPHALCRRQRLVRPTRP